MELPAKCPHCGGKGCDKCVDGQITVTMPEDDWYTRHCTNPLCGWDNGGCQGNRLYDDPAPCMICGETDVVWIPMCDSESDPPWKTHQQDKQFARYLIALEQMPEPTST